MRYSIIVLLACLIGLSSFADKSSISGVISSAKTKKPLTGVKINLNSSKNSYTAISDRNGEYKIAVEPGDYKLTTVSYIVIDTAFTDIHISGAKTFNIELVPICDSKIILKDSGDLFDEDDEAEVTPCCDHSYSKRKKSESTEIKSDVLSSVEAPSAGDAAKTKPEKTVKKSSSKKDRSLVATERPAEGGAEYSSFVTSTEKSSESKESIIWDKAPKRTLLPSSSPDISAGTLTSGELNDFRKWDLWKDIQDSQFKEYSESWSFKPRERFTIQAITNDNRAAIDYTVKLQCANGETIWTGRTDNTGKAELWSNIFKDSLSPDNKFNVKIEKNGTTYSLKNVKEFHSGVNTIKIDESCNNPKIVDIAFVVDATGSMGDEIKYLQAELIDIIGKLKDKQKDLTINLGAAFYRDKGDEYLVNKSDLSSDVNKTIDFIKAQSANGGGDFPEAVEMALQSSINELSWSENATARILFLILDAPPHNEPEVKEKLREIIAKAAMQGIRVVPVVCSGIDKSTEYLMRSLALATNGSYVFLTNNSGVGDSHIEPTTDKYDVEKLNALFIRLIEQFTIVPECAVKNPFEEIKASDNILNQNEPQLDNKTEDYSKLAERVKCYPNPCNGVLNVELKGAIDDLFIVDISGKIIQRLAFTGEGAFPVDLSIYPTGIYFIKYSADNHWFIIKTILER